MYMLGLCDNGKTYISIMIVIDNKSIVHVFWIFAILKLLCILSHLHVLCIVHNSIQEFTIISIIKIYYLYHDNVFISLNYRSALVYVEHKICKFDKNRPSSLRYEELKSVTLWCQ